jgi:hypothetical protein
MFNFSNFYGKLDSLAGKKWFVYFFPLFCIITILFFNCPYYEGVIREPNTIWIFVFKQAAVIFPDTSHLDPASHEAKMTFRLAIPMLIRLFFLKSRFAVYGFQIIIAWFFFYLTRSLFFKILQDRVLSFILTLAIAFIFTGQQFVTDIYGAFDCFAMFFILLAMYYNNPLAIFIGVSLVLWTDERGGLMSLFIIPWVLINQSPDPKKNIIQRLGDLLDSKILSYFFAVAFYIIIRLYLQHKFALSAHIDNMHLKDALARINMSYFGLWEAFEGLWLVVLLFAFCLFNTRNYFLFFILACITGLICFSAFIVADITRSMTYLFPLLIISIYYLAKYQPELKPTLVRTILVGFLICFIMPTYQSHDPREIIKNAPLIMRIMGRF